MLKWAGAICILIGAIGVGNSYSRQFGQHYRQLLALKELLLLLGNEMRYLKMPLPQALKRISGQCEEPFGALLQEVSEKLQSYMEASPSKVWKQIVAGNREKYLLSEDEYRIFQEAGVILEQSNSYMQEEEIRLYQEQLQFKLVHAQEELKTKQKLGRYLCGAGGIFLILLFV